MDRVNPFAPLYRQCNTGTAAEKYRGLKPFPTIIDVELTNACNFSCLFCPTGNKAMRRRTGVMAEETMWRIVADASMHVADDHPIALRLIGWGEPLMHDGLVDMIWHAKRNGLLVHLNTNGSLLDEVGGYWARDLIGAGLDSIKFSFQGVSRQSYREARNIDYYDQLLEKVKEFYAARGDRSLPWIAVSTSTTYETPEDMAAFVSLFSPHVDELSIGKTIFGFFDAEAMRLRSAEERMTFDRLVAAGTVDLVHPDPCKEVYNKLAVSWDGTVRVCCNDFDGVTDLGNVNEASLSKAWMHPTMQEYRERLTSKEYEGPLCSVCYEYMPLKEGE